jgi:RNA recognition motif-containing protein
MDKKKLYVGNLPWSIEDAALKDLFASYGEVVEAVIIKDKYSGRSKGFGFVTFATEEAAAAAEAAMNGKDMEGRAMVVNVARPREERPRGGGGGYNRDNRRPY